ncbi:MAG TPA: hypothetical protein VFW83_07155 [Bryobacteraceae bacterium]|nr:hypothetical protein [Bryobacteraceae bacterium]
MRPIHFYAGFTVAFFCGSIAYSQPPNQLHDLMKEGRPGPHRGLSAREYTIEALKNIMTSPAPLPPIVPRIRAVGNGLAREILGIMATREPLSTTEQGKVLAMIHQAFEEPKAILAPQNRTTQYTFKLLERFDSTTTDFSTRLRITDTRDFVFAQMDAFAAAQE